MFEPGNQPEERLKTQSRWWGLVTRSDVSDADGIGVCRGWFVSVEVQPNSAWKCTYVAFVDGTPIYQTDTWVDTTEDLVSILEVQAVIWGFGLVVDGPPAVPLAVQDLVPSEIELLRSEP